MILTGLMALNTARDQAECLHRDAGSGDQWAIRLLSAIVVTHNQNGSEELEDYADDAFTALQHAGYMVKDDETRPDWVLDHSIRFAEFE